MKSPILESVTVEKRNLFIEGFLRFDFLDCDPTPIVTRVEANVEGLNDYRELCLKDHDREFFEEMILNWYFDREREKEFDLY